jgi:hypothetical protein
VINIKKIFAVADSIPGWRHLHSEEFINVYFSPSIIRMIRSRNVRLTGHVSRTGDRRNAYGILLGKPEERRPLGRPRSRWVDNIKIYLSYNGVVWSGLKRFGLWTTVMNLRVP